MKSKGGKAVIAGVFTYIVLTLIINLLITGTGDVDNIIKQVVPLAVGVGVAWEAFANFIH